jgi:hypothetical protein
VRCPRRVFIITHLTLKRKPFAVKTPQTAHRFSSGGQGTRSPSIKLNACHKWFAAITPCFQQRTYLWLVVVVCHCLPNLGIVFSTISAQPKTLRGGEASTLHRRFSPSILSASSAQSTMPWYGEAGTLLGLSARAMSISSAYPPLAGAPAEFHRASRGGSTLLHVARPSLVEPTKPPNSAIGHRTDHRRANNVRLHAHFPSLLKHKEV